jgi:hypothetical protein
MEAATANRKARRQLVDVSVEEWHLLVEAALKTFVCDPDWSEWDFIMRCLSGNARRKQQ